MLPRGSGGGGPHSQLMDDWLIKIAPTPRCPLHLEGVDPYRDCHMVLPTLEHVGPQFLEPTLYIDIIH